MKSPRKWLRPWMAWSAATMFAATGQAIGQVPNLGGGVPNVGGGGIPNVPSTPNVPNVGGVQNQIGGVPNIPSNGPRVNQSGIRSNVNDAARNSVNRTQQTQQNVGNRVSGQADYVAGRTQQTARQFQAPARGTADFSENLPVQFDAQSVAGLDQNGSLGFSLNTTGDSLTVSNVDTGSLAATSGLQANDEIVAVNRNWVSSTDGFRNDLQSALATSGEAWVMVRRGGNDQWVKINADGAAQSLFGASYTFNNNGLTVNGVTDGTTAAAAGLQAGDRIVAINGTEIRSRADYLGQVQQNVGSEVQLQVDRNGVTETVRAQIPTIEEAAARTVQNVRGKVAEMQQIVNSLENSADQTARGRYQQVQQQLNGISNQIGSRQQDVQNLTQAQIQQTQRRLSEVNNSVNAWKNTATGNVSNQVKSLQDKIAYTQSLLASRIFDTKNSVTTTAQSVAGSAQQTAAGRMQQAQQIAAAQRQNLNQRIDSLSSRVDQLAENQTEQLQGRIAQVRQNVATLRETVGQQAGEAQQLTAQTIAQVRGTAADIRSEIESIQAEATAEAGAELSAAVSDAVAVQAGLTAMAMAQADDTAELAAEIRADVEQSSNNLVTTVEQIQQSADQQLNARTQQLLTTAQQIRERSSQLAENQTDRVLELRDQAAALQNRLMLTARQAQGQTRAQIGRAVGTAAALRGHLTALAVATRDRGQQAVETVLDRTRTRVDTTREALNDARTTVTGQAQDRINTAQQRLESVRGQLGNRVGEVRQFTAEQRAEIVDRLQQTRADLMAAAQNAPETVQENLAEQIANIDSTVEDLAIIEAIRSTSVRVVANQASEFGLQIESAAGKARVTAVESQSAFAKVGLRDGDEITAVNGQSVSTEAEVLEQLNAAVQADETVSLQIQRGDQQQTLQLNAREFSLTSLQN